MIKVLVETLQDVRYNGESKSAGEKLEIEYDLAKSWYKLGLAKPQVDSGENRKDKEDPSVDPENEPENKEDPPVDPENDPENKQQPDEQKAGDIDAPALKDTTGKGTDKSGGSGTPSKGR